jgi:hypothetical protein
MEHRMKKMLILAGLLIIPSLCFAVDYYAEYSFDKAREINSREVRGYNGWHYDFIYHYTKTQIQERINQLKSSEFKERRTAADYMSRMLKASADKRIFVIDTSEAGPCGWIFIKMNENEYIVFYTGQ